MTSVQNIISGRGCVDGLDALLTQNGITKILLVCDSSFPYLSIKDTVSRLSVATVTFDGFTPNPLYDDVEKGVALFRAEGCEAIVAVGGGSSLDVAKCIKLYCRMDDDKVYLQQEYRDSGVPLVAIPTTAGTGSESTRYAVIYYEGQKQSVTHDSIVPNHVFLDPDVLTTLPVYQKKCTMLDALCQGIESWWSVNSTDESKVYSRRAVETIMQHYRAYIVDNDPTAAEIIMRASNDAGKAINITQTTAAHAMSYKITSLYKLPHGHAAAVCLPHVWAYMQTYLSACIDKRGEGYLADTFAAIAAAMGCANARQAVAKFRDLLAELAMASPVARDKADLALLAASVNPVRLGNNPVRLDEDTLYALYSQIITMECE